MTAFIENLPIFLVIAPLFATFLLPTFFRRVRAVKLLVILAGLFSLICAVLLAAKVMGNSGEPLIYKLGGWDAPWGIELKIDSLAACFLMIAAGVSLPVSLYGINNLSNELGNPRNMPRFYVLYLLLMGSLFGMALTNDVFNVFVLVEVATLSCCGLVSSKNSPKAAKAAFSYLILASLGSALILGGIGFIYILTGHLNMGFAFEQLTQVWRDSPFIVWMAVSFMLVGFGIKTALFPLHLWLPDAHSAAPAPASAVLSGLAVKGYFICLLKVLYNIFGTDILRDLYFHKILLTMGMIAIIAGSLSAIMQDEFKRRLAYSTVAQMGYLFIGLGLVNKKGFMGILLYMAAHAICKSILFLSAGAIIEKTGKNKISELSGIGKKMPVTMAAFTIAALGLVGIPLFPGFIGKWNLIMGSLEAGQILPAMVIILGSVLCGAYLLPIIRRAYFMPETSGDVTDPPLPQKIAFIILTGTALFFGVFPDVFLRLAEKAAAEIAAFY